MKKILSLFMLVMCIAVGANAQITHTISNGVLTISGTGAGEMPNYAKGGAPWYGQSFTTVVIEAGVTSIGNYAFQDCYNLECIYYYGNNSSLITKKAQANSVFYGTNYEEIYIYTLPGVDSWYGLMGRNFYSENNEVLWTLHDDTLSVKSNNAYSDGNFVMPAAFVDYLSEVLEIELDGANQLTVNNGLLLADGGSKLLLATDKAAITIPSAVTSIGDYALYGAMSMTALHSLPLYAPTLGDNVFYDENGYLFQNVDLYLTNLYELGSYSAWTNDYKFKSVNIGTPPTSGSWSASMTWETSGTTLTIEGNGEIPNSNKFVNDWKALGVKTVVIKDGVTKIGSNVFVGLGATSFTIPASVTSVGTDAFYGNGSAMYNFNSNVALGTSGISNNATLNLVLADKVDLAANVNTFDKITLARAFAANSGGTLILPFEAVVPNGMKVYELKKFSNKVMQFEELNTIAANTPYVWRSTKNVSSISSLEKTTLNHNDATTEYAGTTVDDWTLYGVLNSKTISAEKPGVTSDLWIYVGSTGQFKNYDAVKVAPYRAYLKGWAYNEVFSDAANNINASFPERSLSIEFIDMDGTTSIEEVIVDREGNISSAAEDGAYYDLSGRRVENPTTGIYIVNGKKVLVK